jgi:IS5 family transposase
VKVTIATTLKEGLVVGMRSMPCNPYDRHALADTLEQVGILTGTDRPPATAVVDMGYRGVKVEEVRILMSSQKLGVNRALKAMIKKRSVVEPTIGLMKMNGRLGRNPLQDALGDVLHAVMSGAGHNRR